MNKRYIRRISVLLLAFTIMFSMPQAGFFAYAVNEQKGHASEQELPETQGEASDDKHDGSEQKGAALQPAEDEDAVPGNQTGKNGTEETGDGDKQTGNDDVKAVPDEGGKKRNALKAAHSGSVGLSGSEITFVKNIEDKFFFFKSDNISLTHDDDGLQYRVIVKSVTVPQGGSYHWDGTNYTAENGAYIEFHPADCEKDYSIVYQAQYQDTDDGNKWKDIDGVSWTSTVAVDGEVEKDYVTEDEAKVKSVKMFMTESGSEPFDNNNEPGNDENATNDIVRSFDTVHYRVEYATDVKDFHSVYNHGYLWVELTLPCPEEQAALNTKGLHADMKGLKKNIVTDDEGNPVKTVYTFYYERHNTIHDGVLKHAVPNEGSFFLAMDVFAASNRQEIKPEIRMAVAQLELGSDGKPKTDDKGNYKVARNYSEGEGAYDVPVRTEGPGVRVSAAPGFNVTLKGVLKGKTVKVWDFSTGNERAIDKNAGQVYGKPIRLGVELQMRNSDPAKGLRGLELPNGSDITFQLDLRSWYSPDDDADPPLIWSVGSAGRATDYGRDISGIGYTGTTRIPDDARRTGNFTAPNGNTCDMWNGGKWTLERVGNTGIINVTVSDYIVNPLWFPTGDANDISRYLSGGKLTAGRFSARNIDLIIPFGSNIKNRGINDPIEYASSEDDPLYYPNLYGREGNISFDIRDKKLSVTSVSGANTMTAPYNEILDNGQTLYDGSDDSRSDKVTLSAGSSSSRSIHYTYPGITDHIDVNKKLFARNDGRDAVRPGTSVAINGNANFFSGSNDTATYVYAAHVLVKFDDEVLSPENTDMYTDTQLFAAKKNGKGWEDDTEMKNAVEEDLYYYTSLEALENDGKTCVAVLREYVNEEPTGSQKVKNHVRLKVTEDPTYYDAVVMTSMNIKYWRKAEYEAVKTANGGSFPSHSDSRLNGTTVVDYLADKSGLSGEALDAFRKSITPVSDERHSKTLEYQKASYDEDGYHEGSGTETSWGDSLHIVPYYMAIGKVVEQKEGPSTTNPVQFSFSNQEHIVDYRLTTSFSMPDNAGGVEGKTTTVTVTDILPEGLTYVSGSSYLGGEYQGNGAHNRLHGSVIGGENVEPRIEILEDGRTRLVWIIEDAVIGDNSSLPVIRFSAEMDQSIQATETWVNRAYVRSTEDNRAYGTTQKNEDTATIQASPATNLITQKTPSQFIHNQNETLGWTLRWENNSTTAFSERVMMDVMPYDGDPWGSRISGSYTVRDITYDFPHGKTAGDYAFYYSTDTAARTPGKFDEGFPYEDFAGDEVTVKGVKWKKGSIEEDGTVPALEGMNNVVAFVILGEVPGRSEIEAEINIDPSGNKSGDRYVNIIKSNELIMGSSIYIAERQLRGTVWKEDSDSVDGERQSEEKRLKGVRVILKVKTKDGGWEEYDRTETDKNGRYLFRGMPPGDYRVEFTNGGATSLKHYRLTERYADGVGTHVDSDAEAVGGDAVFAVITKERSSENADSIMMPDASVINTTPYVVEYLDMGLWLPDRDITVSKEWSDEAAESVDGYARPDSVKVSLLADGEVIDTRVLNGQNEWTEKFTGLPYYREDTDGTEKEIEYSVHEETVGDAGCTEVNGQRRYYLYDEDQSVSGSEGVFAVRGYFTNTSEYDEETDSFKVTNTFVPADEEENGEAGFYVKKVDARGEAITGSPAAFELRRKDSDESVVVYTDRDTGIAVFANLSAGIYTVTEKEAPAGYIRSDKAYTVTVSDEGRALVEVDKEGNTNIFRRMLKLAADADWDDDSLTFTVSNRKDSKKKWFGGSDSGRARTGDQSSLALMIALFTAGAVSLAVMAARRRKNR